MTETSPPSTTGYEAAAPVQAMVVGASAVVAGLVGGILERLRAGAGEAQAAAVEQTALDALRILYVDGALGKLEPVAG